MKDKELYASASFSSPSSCTLTICKAEKKEVVYIVSSINRNVNNDKSHKKKLSETMQHYNKSKIGVNVLDQTRNSFATQQPLAVVFKILDCACINDYIAYCFTTKLKL